MPKRKVNANQQKAVKKTKQVTQRLTIAAVHKRTIGVKKNPQTSTFAKISLEFKDERDYTLNKNEFECVLVSAIRQTHGNVAGQPDILGFEAIDSRLYKAVIRFPTIHHTRIVTGLILFGEYKQAECKFEIVCTAQTPCFLIT